MNLCRGVSNGSTVAVYALEPQPQFHTTLDALAAASEPDPRCRLTVVHKAAWFRNEALTFYEVACAPSESESECLDPQMSCEPRGSRVCNTTHPEPPYLHPR